MSSRSGVAVAFFLIFIISSPLLDRVSAQEASGGILVTVSQVGAVIEEFSVAPREALPGEIATFSVKVRNVGELPIEIAPTSRVEISLRGNPVRTLYLTPPADNVPPNGEVTLTVEWIVENSHADNYTATAIVYYDGYSATASRGFSILKMPVELPPEVYPEFEAIETATSPPASPGNPAVFNFTALVITQMVVRVTRSVGESTATVAQSGALPTFLREAIPAVPYKYLWVNVSGIPENAVSGATLNFRVEKLWLSGNSIKESSIRMYRFSENGWSALPTAKTGENATHVFYSAESPGFSFFGIGGLALPQEEYLAWERRPVLVELVQGETRFLSLTLGNKGSGQLGGVEVGLSGNAADMVAMVPGRFTLGPLENMSLVAVFSASGSAALGDYWLRLTARSGEALADVVALVRVKPSPGDSPAAARTVEIDSFGGKTLITLYVVNSRRALSSVEVVEDVPKWLASTADEVSSDEEYDVIESDPRLRWIISDVKPYERRTVSYFVDRIPEDITALLYWPIGQLTAVFKVSVELVRVLEIYSERMALGGTGRINITLRNIGENAMGVRVRLELPPAWEVMPVEMVVTLQPGIPTTILFTATNPPYAEPGLYMGQLRLSYGGEEYVKGVAILVTFPGDMTWMFNVFFILIIVLIVLFVVVRRMLSRGSGGKAITILERIKRE